MTSDNHLLSHSLVSYVFFLKSPVPHPLSHVSCLICLETTVSQITISCLIPCCLMSSFLSLLFYISCLIPWCLMSSLLSLLSHISCLTSPVSHILSQCLMSPFSRLLSPSHVTGLTTSVSCLTSTSPVCLLSVSCLRSVSCLLSVSCLSLVSCLSYAYCLSQSHVFWQSHVWLSSTVCLPAGGGGGGMGQCLRISEMLKVPTNFIYIYVFSS